MESDYYRLLGVNRAATATEIRKAYYRMAKIWHPDVSKARDAKIRFQQINKAYRILSNPLLRRAYDQRLSDPWVQNVRRDYYRYGTSSQATQETAPSTPPHKANPFSSPFLDRMLFSSLIIIGVLGMMLGIRDLLLSTPEEPKNPGGLVLGLFFTLLLLLGWRALRKEGKR